MLNSEVSTKTLKNIVTIVFHCERSVEYIVISVLFHGYEREDLCFNARISAVKIEGKMGPLDLTFIKRLLKRYGSYKLSVPYGILL